MTASAAPRTRLILYVGKGGVGKTTIAAATGVLAAASGKRTLVVSTDVAHSLGDTLDAELSGDAREVAPLLFAQEVNVLEEARRSWGTVQRHVAEFLEREGIPPVQADELAVVPGMQEIAALVEISRRVREHAYECIVVDAAPTGETIRLLTMPDSFTWYAGKVSAWKGRMNRIARGLMKSAVPTLAVLDIVDELKGRLAVLRRVLTDREHSSYRIVVTPERTVVKEAQRAETYLNLFEYPVDAVIVNRVLPSNGGDSGEYMRRLVERQRSVMQHIRASFGAVPMFVAPMTEDEPVGIEALERLGKLTFGDADATSVLHVGPTTRFEQSADGYELRIPMPNVELGRIVLNKRGDELYVDIGNFRREISLPSAVAACEPRGARFREGTLLIEFVRHEQSKAATKEPARSGGAETLGS